MGRWKQEGNEVVWGGSTPTCVSADKYYGATEIVTRHNADCDAYEARIAELEAERDAAVEFAHSAEQAFCAANTALARVKAESLRVVPVGDAVSVDHAPLGIGFTAEGHSGVFRRIGSGCSANPIETYALLKRAESDDEVRVPHGTIVQPVRLERWEDEG